MNTTYATFLLFFGIIFYIILVDKNVEDYLFLVFKITKVNFQRLIWMIKYHPRNPITNFIKEIEYTRLAKELEKEFKTKSND